MNKFLNILKKNWFIIVATLLIAASFLYNDSLNQEKPTDINITKVFERVENGEVDHIVVEGNKIEVFLINPEDIGAGVIGSEVAYKEDNISLTQYGITPDKVKIEVKDGSSTAMWIGILSTFIPFLLIVGFLWFMMKQAQGANSQAMSFGKSKAKLNFKNQKTTFADVAGSEEAKKDLVEVVDFLKYPQKYRSLGAEIPRGLLLVGPPGTGKTLLAKAVSGEAGVPFFNISGSEFVEMFVGVGASRVRDLFAKARRNAPCIIFIDEIDAVGRQRGAGLGGPHDEREQTLNQILVELDGFETDANVIVIAATNRPDVLDPALLRPGRFDRRVLIDLPDISEREAILNVHAKGKPMAEDVNLKSLAQKTPGFSGADLKNLVNEGAILSASKGAKKVEMRHLDEAIEKVMLGPERRSKVISDEEKKITAYHEAGHALVSHFLPNADPVHKISIVSRGRALGYTWNMPERDRVLYSKSKFEDDIAMLLAGREAEMIVFGELTTGAQSDLTQANKLARKMVTEYGMSEKLGPLSFNGKDELVFLGKDIAEAKNYSEKTAQIIDEEVGNIIDRSNKKAKEVIVKYKEILDKITNILLEKEILERDEFESLIKSFSVA